MFFAVELAKALGYKKPHEALKDKCKSLIKFNSSQTLELNLGFYPKGIILASESDLYRLILKSKLPSAERVQDWVCEEVLPALRQQGSYICLRKNTRPPPQISKILNVSANKIGHIANDNNMKNDTYGKYYLDKSRYSTKHVESFYYNEKTLQKFNDIFVAKQEAAASEFV